MTEDEMKTKWCPFWRPGETATDYYPNRPDKLLSEDSAGFCIGSDCAMWVPEYRMWNEKTGAFLEPGVPYSATDLTYEKEVPGCGRCGLVR